MPEQRPGTDAPDPDAADARAAAAGDERAFARLYARHAGRVLATARWLGIDDAEGSVQDVFVRLWEQLGSFEGRSAFRTWFSRVTVHVLLRRREQAARDQRRAGDPAALDHQPARAAGADLRSEMADAVERLPPRAREVFVLHDVHGYAAHEIATLLGLSVNTVRSQIMRSRLRLRHHLGDAAPEGGA